MLDKHSKSSSQNGSLESSLGAELNIKGLDLCFWSRSGGCEWTRGRVKLQAACALGSSLVIPELRILYNQILMMQSAGVSSSSWIPEWYSFTLEAGFGKHDTTSWPLVETLLKVHLLSVVCLRGTHTRASQHPAGSWACVPPFQS